MRALAFFSASLLAACSGPPSPDAPPAVEVSATFTVAGDWPSYGRDAGGSRFSPLRQITLGNVGELREAWA